MRQRIEQIIVDARRADCLTESEMHTILAAMTFVHDRVHDVVNDREEFIRRFGTLAYDTLNNMMEHSFEGHHEEAQ